MKSNELFLVAVFYTVVTAFDPTLANTKLFSQEDQNHVVRRSADDSRTAGIAWNEVIDIIFSIASHEIIDQGVDVVALPDVHKSFQRKIGFLTVKGLFIATDGQLSNISSLVRTEDASVVKEDFKWKMVCVFKLNELKVRYNNYKMNITGFTLQGSIEGTVSTNSVKMALVFESTAGGCKSSLESVRIETMEGLNVNVTGLGSFNFLGSAMAKWAVEQKKADIIETVELVLSREARKALSEFQCDEYASLLML